MKSVPIATALVGGLIVLTPLSAVAGPQFLAYEGKNAVHEGRGGEKKIVDGVDFWMNGAPPRKFQVLGSLTDRRHETGIYGMIRMSALDSDVAKAAKQAGGDAVILQGEGEEVVGVASFGNTNLTGDVSGNVTGGPGLATFSGQTHAWGTSNSFTRAIKKHDARFIVVRYLPDEAAPASPSSAAPAASPSVTAPPASSENPQPKG